MLQFLIFLGWVLVFCTPLISSLFSIARDKEVSASRWCFNAFWAVGGGALIIFLGYILHVWTDALWFEELGYPSVFWTMFWAKWKYFLFGAVGSFIFFLVNIGFIRAGAKEARTSNLYPVVAVYFIAACLFGLLAKAQWNNFLLCNNQVPFGVNDPIFAKDIGFYVFTLPVLKFQCSFLSTAVIFAMIGTGVIYAIQYEDNNSYGHENVLQSIRFRCITHISILGVILMIIFIFATKVAIWNLMFSTRGVVFGAGWTDVHAQIGAYKFFMGALVLAGIFFLISAIARSVNVTISMAIIGFGTCILTWLIGVALIPTLIEKFGTEPNALTRETEYIKHNIAFTQRAYGLTKDQVTQSEFPVNADVNSKILEEDKATLDSIRLWDWRVLQSNNSQNQGFRLYYSFPDVDVVRYSINGKLVQLMYSGRELDQEKLAPQSKTWQNTRLVYTHGFGGCANPVSIFTQEGMPNYWIKDIPPVSKFPELSIEQPRIYFGERTTTHVYIKTKQPEFDYPKGDENTNYTYEGPAGIEVGTGLRKFAFAMRFDGIRLLTSNQITPESKIMFRRDIESRIRTLAPFLKYDHDDYQVVALGQLWQIWDAYTTTKHYPYSEPHNFHEGTINDINYIRNSVKATLNSYTGKVEFYVFDEQDPIIKTYEKIFPGLFKQASEMPDALRQHARYPEDLLRIQGEIYSVYHMENPLVFYNKEDAWEIAKEASHGVVQRVLPYYVIMKVPGEKEEEFVQMLPFTPLTTDERNPRNNMVAWLAGRCDGEHYGQLVLYKFPKERLVYGPLQIGIRINQDDVISKDFTLWNQQGSQVVSGNLLVIPLNGHRLLYVQPIYLQAEVGKMPELKRVVVASGDRLAYGTSFENALEKLIGSSYASITQTEVTETAKESASAKTKNELIKEAARHLELYQQLTGQGKFTEAGKEMEQLTKIISELLKKGE